MPTEYVNRARNNSTGAHVYWTTTGSGDPAMTKAGSPDAGTHSRSVVVGTRDVDTPTTPADPAFTVAVAHRYVLITGASPLQVTHAATINP